MLNALFDGRTEQASEVDFTKWGHRQAKASPRPKLFEWLFQMARDTPGSSLVRESSAAAEPASRDGELEATLVARPRIWVPARTLANPIAR